MNNERALLAAFLKSRQAYEKVENKITRDDLTEQGRIIFSAIREYYDSDRKATTIDHALLTRAILRGLSNPKHQETFRAVISGLVEEEASPENVIKDFIGVKRDAVGNKLATALVSCASADEVAPLLDEYNEWLIDDIEEEEGEYVGVDIADLVESAYSTDELIRLYPNALNNRLDGGMLRGQHVIVFARPEMGKSMFVINLMYGFCQQGLKVLYIGNEDPIQDIIMRFVCRTSGMTKFDVIGDPVTANDLVRTRGYDNVVFVPMDPGTPRQIEALVVKHKPDVLIVDQLRNISIKEDNYTRQLERVALAIRMIAKRNNMLAVSVTQAGDSASGKAILEMGDVDSSNTGIPAQADVMIGIGATDEDERLGRRVINLPKNKRSGLHEFFPVSVNPQLSKVTSLG